MDIFIEKQVIMKNDLLKSLFLFIFVGISCMASSKMVSKPLKQVPKAETMVLCVGTIHHQHGSNPNYTYADLYRILKKYQPDVICLEIPPSYFRTKPYLKEMTLGAIYGLEHGAKVYPIDWWSEGNPRAERKEYMKTEDYEIKQKMLDSLSLSDSVMRRFEKVYGTIEQVFKENTKGYRFFNGKDYNSYVKNMYGGLITVFGDGCMNLYSEQRNEKMMEMINTAIDSNQGKRVIILTGAEHKYYFDNALSDRKGVRLRQLADFMPLGNEAMTQEMEQYLELGLSDEYYTNKEIMYWSALIPFLHGPNMDENPYSIHAEALKKAEKIIKKWEQSSAKNSVLLYFNQAWYHLCTKNYKTAIAFSDKTMKHLGDVPLELQNFIIPFFWRNLGFCYDLQGKRKQAVRAYLKGIKYCKEKKMDTKNIEYIFKDYDKVAYHI